MSDPIHKILHLNTVRECPETKRRLHNLLAASGLLDQLVTIKPRAATLEEVARSVRHRGINACESGRMHGGMGLLAIIIKVGK